MNKGFPNGFFNEMQVISINAEPIESRIGLRSLLALWCTLVHMNSATQKDSFKVPFPVSRGHAACILTTWVNEITLV